MSTSLKDSIAAEVRAEVARQDLTQQQLADRIGPPASQWWVSRRLTGDVAIAADELVKIANALGVPVTKFLPATESGAA